MYDRTTRFTNEKVGDLKRNIGPGTYDIPDGLRTLDRPGYAPFSSLAARETFLDIKETRPGPGAYNPNFVFEHIEGGSTAGNKSLRFMEKFLETPGPGNYEIALDIGGPSKNKDNQDKQPRLHTLPLHHPEPPSIPCPGQAFGYEEGQDGVLRRQNVPNIDRSLGPAFYNVRHGDTETTKKYKGIHFSSMTGKRVGETCIDDIPGPGTYSINESIPNVNTVLVEEQKKKVETKKIPRYHEMIPIAEKKKGVPGPGRYEAKGTFEPKEPIYDATLRPSFGSKTKRFYNPKDITPGPDVYTSQQNFEGGFLPGNSKKHPFGQSSLRFDISHSSTATPAPDSYKISGLADDLAKKAILSSNLRGGFGSSSAREYVMRGVLEDNPGPSCYSANAGRVSSRKSDKRNATYKSLSNRLSNCSFSDAPPPGSYNLPRMFTKQYGVPSKVPGKPIDGGFLSSTKRFSQPRDVVAKTSDPVTPGPGAYSLKEQNRPGVSIVSNIDRFKGKENYVPGPGTYELSPLLRHTVLKGTFNATLNNPVESALVERSGRSSQLSLTVTG